ncbi:hypothetical protein MMC06_005372 [Schaereria dolodes]|nr:hypothetical protein [Schaereria dolodes]
MSGDSEMRLSASLKEWKLEMMEIRYAFLGGLNSVIKTPLKNVLGRKTSRLTLDRSFYIKEASAIPSRISSQAGKMPVAGLIKASVPAVAAMVEDPLKQLDGHVILLVGGIRPRFDGLFQADGGHNLAALVSTTPGDFSELFSRLYFSKQYEVAWK